MTIPPHDPTRFEVQDPQAHLDAIADHITAAGSLLGALPGDLEAQQLAQLRQTLQLIGDLGSFATEVVSRAVRIHEGPSPKFFATLDPQVITRHIFPEEFIPKPVPPDPYEIIPISVTGYRSIESRNVYEFEQTEDGNLLLALFNGLIACRDRFPITRILTHDLQRMRITAQDPKPAVKNLVTILNDITGTAGTRNPAAEHFNRGSAGSQIRLSHYVIIQYGFAELAASRSSDVG